MFCLKKYNKILRAVGHLPFLVNVGSYVLLHLIGYNGSQLEFMPFLVGSCFPLHLKGYNVSMIRLEAKDHRNPYQSCQNRRHRFRSCLLGYNVFNLAGGFYASLVSV